MKPASYDLCITKKAVDSSEITYLLWQQDDLPTVTKIGLFVWWGGGGGDTTSMDVILLGDQSKFQRDGKVVL